MAITNSLKQQVDLPVWEWCRLAPAVSSSVSSACAAENSLYHVNHGRYIYYMQAVSSTPVAGTASNQGTGFFRYDTVTDSYQ